MTKQTHWYYLIKDGKCLHLLDCNGNLMTTEIGQDRMREP
jgi:hypothetical protein